MLYDFHHFFIFKVQVPCSHEAITGRLKALARTLSRVGKILAIVCLALDAPHLVESIYSER